MATSVFGIATSEANAGEIVRQLKANRFTENDISVLLPDKSGTRDFATENSTKAPEGAALGAGAGGALGGGLGLLVGIGALAIPGVGPFIAAGPLLAALSGAAVGAAAGGLTGALIGLGIPEYEAKQYEGKIKAGGILISVHCANGEQVTTAKRILKECGATDISSGGEKSAPDASEEHDDVDHRRAAATHPAAHPGTHPGALRPTPPASTMPSGSPRGPSAGRSI